MTKDEFKKNLLDELIQKHGMLIGGIPLSQLLGFPSMAAFRKGLERGVVEVPVITFENRRGKFALAVDISQWLTENRYKVTETE